LTQTKVIDRFGNFKNFTSLQFYLARLLDYLDENGVTFIGTVNNLENLGKEKEES